MAWRSKLGLFQVPFLPKGNALQEICHLPVYHYYVQKHRPDKMVVKKHFFGNHPHQYVLHCHPAEGTEEQPFVVVFYHGGGWAVGNPEMFTISAAFYTRQGYHVLMPCHRKIPRFRFRHIREDVDLGYLKVREVMEDLGVGNQKIMLSGMSAGANLAALLAFDRKALQRLDRTQADFEGLLLMGAPLDLHRMTRTPVLRLYAGGRQGKSFQQASPISFLTSQEDLPILMIHGTADGLVPYPAASAFAKRLEECHTGNFEFYTIDGGTHLDTGSWNFFENRLREKIRKWMAGLKC